MEKGKEICKMLKEIRKQIAQENDIDFVTSECKHKGNCAGTCPKCEEEVAYLEEQLEARKRQGMSNRVVGIALGIAATIPSILSCNVKDAVVGKVPDDNYLNTADTIMSEDSSQPTESEGAQWRMEGDVCVCNTPHSPCGEERE